MMEQNFIHWQDNSRCRLDDDSISNSDEKDVFEISATDKHKFIIDKIYNENYDDADNSENWTPKKNKSIDNYSTPVTSLTAHIAQRKLKIIDFDDNTNNNESEEEYYTFNNSYNSDSDKKNLADKDYDFPVLYSSNENNNRKRKDINYNNIRKDIKLELNSSNECLIKYNNLYKQDIHHKISDHEMQEIKIFHDVAATIVLDTDSNSGRNNESNVALSFEKQEIRNIDPLVAKKTIMTEQLEQKLHKSTGKQETKIEKLKFKLEKTPLLQSINNQENKVSKKLLLANNELLFKDEPYSHSDHSDYSYSNINNILTSLELKQLGEKAQATRDRELALTIERLQDLHGSLVACPAENEKAENPKGLKVQLMPHQQHALAWLLWREQQKPAGGILADDMGLGKTLTMISLIMTTLAQKDSTDESDGSDCEWSNDHESLYHKGGTLVVCPASLLFQWDNEVRNRCKRDLLSLEIYHGSNRESVSKHLSKNDLVITTYNILSREYKTRSILYKINWKRIILDEAHIVRNHKSQASLAVCGLKANKRWALTGTPIQNKAMDLYSILKFLKCSPFDNLCIWKRWVDNKNGAGYQRLATIMKTLMLRRTKQELIEKGDLETLPGKSIEEVMVKLDPQEQLVYEKILIYSRTLFAQFLAQKAEKEYIFDLNNEKYDMSTHFSNPNKETQFTKVQNKLLTMHVDIKTHDILMLLLRLRQLCCHPALIHAILDQDDMKQSGIMDDDNMDPDLLSRVNNISLNRIDKGNEDVNIDQKIVENLFIAENPVFDDDRISSKMRMALNMVEKILQKGKDKLIIVSQWTTLLDVIASHLSLIKGATFSKFTGNVAIKDRQNIVDSFNNRNSDPRILLLSLTAGGVGLNLIGGNHLLLFDIHWNPQLETQAQDRIYRFGQTKDVYIYKFICIDTIEERVKILQEQKLKIVNNVLSCDKNNSAMKLTLNDLKSLFSF